MSVSHNRASRRSALAALVVATLGLLIVQPPAGHAAGAQDPGRAWLAMGDSYSSGEGIPRTNDVDEAKKYQGRDCQRATGVNTDAVAWAPAAQRMIGADLGIRDQIFVACTGAVTNEIAGQIQEARARKGRDSWDLVTFSIGGNDIGFADILKGCLDVDSVWAVFDVSAGCDTTEAEIRTRIDQLRVKLADIYALVRSAVNPGGDVIVVGYPHIVEEEGRWSAWQDLIGNCEGIIHYDVAMLRSATGYLNEQLALAVADANKVDPRVKFHFLDISTNPYETSGDSADRHALCSPAPWLNGRTLSVESSDFRLLRSFHPTQVGHQATASVLADFIRNNVTFADAPGAPTPQAAAHAYIAAAISQDTNAARNMELLDGRTQSERDAFLALGSKAATFNTSGCYDATPVALCRVAPAWALQLGQADGRWFVTGVGFMNVANAAQFCSTDTTPLNVRVAPSLTAEIASTIPVGSCEVEDASFDPWLVDAEGVSWRFVVAGTVGWAANAKLAPKVNAPRTTSGRATAAALTAAQTLLNGGDVAALSADAVAAASLLATGLSGAAAAGATAVSVTATMNSPDNPGCELGDITYSCGVTVNIPQNVPGRPPSRATRLNVYLRQIDGVLKVTGCRYLA